MVNSKGIVLLSENADSDDDNKMYCTIVVNNKSVNLTPFKKIRFTYVCDFYTSINGIDGIGDFVVLSAEKRQLKSVNYAFYGGFLTTTVTDVDVSDINQQAFFYVKIRSASSASGGTTTISKIEFIK